MFPIVNSFGKIHLVLCILSFMVSFQTRSTLCISMAPHLIDLELYLLLLEGR